LRSKGIFVSKKTNPNGKVRSSPQRSGVTTKISNHKGHEETPRKVKNCLGRESTAHRDRLTRNNANQNLGKEKGCDFGYALAANSCERVHSVDACTVTAFDAITAFAVPNPNASSQNRRFFQVWVSNESLHRTQSPSLLRISYMLLMPTLSAIDASHPNRQWRIVNAEDWCKSQKFFRQPGNWATGQNCG
jgi:hypothetical protein